MKIDVCLNKNKENPQELHNLFIQGKEDSRNLLYQDRRNNPYKFWDLIQIARNPEYFVVYKNKEIIGCSARIEHELNPEFEGYRGFIDTDLFISPANRSLNAIRALVEARFIQGTNDNNLLDFYWGIEHEPMNLNLCARLAEKHKVSFEFLSNSTLYQIPTYVFPEKITNKFQLLKLSTIDKKQLIIIEEEKEKSRSNQFVFPHLPCNFIQRLCDFEEESWILTNSNYSAGVVLTSLRTYRRWLSTGSLNIEFEKLRRARGYSELINREIKFLMLGHSWGSSNQIEELIISSAERANELGFDFLVFRDLPKPNTELPVFEFKRRVFFIFHTNSDFKKILSKHLNHSRIETFFV